MPFKQHTRVKTRIAEIEKTGGDCGDYELVLERLRLGRDIPDRYRDHALAGKLSGLRSVIVGSLKNGRSVVAVYQMVGRTVAVAIVDEHDQAYASLQEEKATRRR